MAKTKRRPIRFISIILLVWCVLLGLTAALLLFSSGEAERGLEETLNVRVEQARDRQETLLNNIYLTSRNILGNVMYDSDIGEILQRAPRGDAQSIRTMRNKLRLTQNIHMNDIEYRRGRSRHRDYELSGGAGRHRQPPDLFHAQASLLACG